MQFKVIWFTCFWQYGHNSLNLNWFKIEKWAVSSWDTNPRSNFCDLDSELICHNKWYPGTSEISTSTEIAVENTPVFLLTDGEASWLLLASSVSLLSGSTIHLKNTYSRIFKVTGLVWENQKRISINTSHSYHQHSSSQGKLNWSNIKITFSFN